jgi:peptide/bleomycin uptake transporter
MIQKALAKQNSITIEEYFESLFSFISLAGLYVALYVVISFFYSSLLI